MNGLLLLKHAFNFATDEHSSHDLLPSWNPGRRNHECYCSWEGVVCSNLNNTTRVTQLWLSWTRDVSTYSHNFSASLNASSFSQGWYLNASMFLPFEELQLLDLSHNFLTGIHGTLRLKKLQSLNLGDNLKLNLVPNLAELPSLKEVDLHRNPLESLIPLQGLKLQVLNLEGIASNVPMYNISIIWEMTSLLALSLAESSLDLSLEDLCGLVNLEELDIGYNIFHGLVPTCLANMTSLRALDLKSNYLQGTIPPSLFSSLNSLEYLSLSGNSFQGSISFASLGNSSKLEVFELVDNFYQLGINTENPLYLPPISSQMKIFRMSNCILNKQNGGAIPSFLHAQHWLRELELSHCRVQGAFPNWLLENNTHLWYLNLMSNSISGKLNLNSSSSALVNFSELDLSANHLEGTLPFNISPIFPNLEILNMSNNVIQGKIPYFRGMISILDLSSNKFTGEQPPGLFTGCASLDILKLSDNFLSGRVPQLPGHLSALYLNDNEFTGDISSVLQNNSGLTVLDISSNLLEGAVPHSIGDIQSLEYLVLSDNSFKGSLPLSFCNLQNLLFLDLSGNDIGPEMPPCTNTSYVQHLHLQSTNLRGLFPKFLHGASSLVTLDLRGNALSSSIPAWIGTLVNLRVLVLQGNNFSGEIPQNICQLSELGIPSCLNNVTFGKREFYSESLTTSGYQGSSTAANCDFHRKLCFGSSVIREYVNVENFVAVNFLTKKRLETYKGTVLEYMSGLDLSSNNLSGSIPSEIGWLSQLHALNLSNNHLSGSIPIAFHNLKHIESLDLSCNSLSGEIPPQLTELFGLSVFSVAHNNLSGRTPEMKNQFSTFDQTSYEGNPLLCGLPLEGCVTLKEDSHPKSLDDSETEENPFKDMFWWSSAGAYPVAFVVTIFIIYMNNNYNLPRLLGR